MYCYGHYLPTEYIKTKKLRLGKETIDLHKRPTILSSIRCNFVKIKNLKSLNLFECIQLILYHITILNHLKTHIIQRQF
jgi:hypothetical protein